jgi:hypothetical protein
MEWDRKKGSTKTNSNVFTLLDREKIEKNEFECIHFTSTFEFEFEYEYPYLYFSRYGYK